jgi:hypothetical protein
VFRKANRPYKNEWIVGDFKKAELRHTIKRLKKGKAPGPDLAPIEFYKWLDEENLDTLLTIFNEWWTTGTFPEEKLKAITASIYKKGDPKKQENYRPISLLNSCYKIYAAMIQTRIANTIDRYLQRTQYGFRKSRSTVIPLACVRRIIERAEATKSQLHVVFLDWEKAFDKIDHEQLMWALDKLGFPRVFMDAIRALYNNPQFAVRIDGKCSSWRTQHRGIRQGCPLSPYLFLCVMHTLFEEVHDEINVKRGTVEGLDYTELVYADDTALITNNVTTMNKLLAAIEKHARVFGLNFNKSKCVSMGFHSHQHPKFGNGDFVPTQDKAVYLGGLINAKHDVKPEISAKIGSCFAVLNRLNFFWGKANCPKKFKLLVFDAVIRAKLVYGLDTVAIPPNLMAKLNVFQLKGLRKILGLKTTFIDRANSNKEVFRQANAERNPNGEPNKEIRSFQSYVEYKQEALLKHLVRADENDPLKMATFEPDTVVPRIYVKRRVGRPRKEWTVEAYKRLYLKHNYGTEDTWKIDSYANILKLITPIRNRQI